MNIIATVLLVLMIPLTILCNSAMRDSKRITGPDVMGPAFVTVVTCVIRWIGAAIIIGLLVGGGSFDAAIPNRGLQILLLVGTFALIELSSGMLVVACAPQENSAGNTLISVGRALSFAIPICLLFWLVPYAHAFAPRTANYSIFAIFILVSIVLLPTFNSIRIETNRQQNDRVVAYWENQRMRTEQGKAEIAALPEDCPLEQLSRYIVEDWPSDVRADAFQRLRKRQGIADELMTMLADDSRRSSALKYMKHMPDEPAPDFNERFRMFSLALAQRWRAAEPSLTDPQTAQLAVDSEDITSLAYGRHNPTTDFFPVMDAWKQTLAGAPQVPAITHARHELDHRFELFPRPVSTSTQPATVR